MRRGVRPRTGTLWAIAALVAVALVLGSCAGGNDSIPRYGTVAGTVVADATSLGISGASVTVGGITTTTAETGSFTIRNVPLGDQTYAIAATGFEPVQNGTVRVRANETSRIDARLSALPADAGTVHGVVTDAVSGEPVEAARVTIGTASTVTSAQGVYTLAEVASGDRTVTFTKAGYDDRQETVAVVTGGDHELNVTLAPKTTGTIAGTVSDAATGGDLAGVSVSIETLGSTTTASDGTYLLPEVPAGTWTVRYTRTGYRDVERSVTVTAAQTTTQDVAMMSPSQGTLSGQVRNQTSGGLQAGVHVTIVELERTTDTDASGYYEFAGVASGVYTVLFALTDYGTLTRNAVEVEGGETTVLDVELAPTVGGLVGWVWEIDPGTGGHGGPVEDATVRVGNDLNTRTTDSDGHYEAHDIPATVAGTTYTVYAWSTTHDLASVQVTLRAGEIVQVPDIVLHPAE